MESRGFYNEILTEHNLRPEFKHDLPDADIVLEGVNPSCGDDIWLKLKVDGDVITDGAFVGDGCAISQASADIMLGMIIGKTKDEALRLGNLFLRMIKGEASDEEIDKLEEAGALKDISHMPARVKCAVLGWHALEEAFGTFTPCGDVAGNGPCHYFAVPGFQGRIGFISAVSHKFCSECNRIRLTSEGFLKTCLQYDNGVELKTILRGGGTDEDLRRAIGQALAEKPKGHNFEKKTEFTDREHRGMSQIGG